MSSILNFFSKIAKGDKGENEVLSSITQLLRQGENKDNFFLLQKVKIPDITKTVEIDLLLIHPTLGLYVIEVKNWDSLDFLDQQNNPFDQVDTYKNLLLAFLEDKMGKIPINIESKVVFPAIKSTEAKSFFAQNPYYKNYSSSTFFQDDLQNRDLFQEFFQSSNTIIPNKKEFMSIASYLMDKKSIKEAQNRIVPIITKDEILFFDHKQLSILNGYSGGFRVIRGVAGTGKTIILTNFIQNKLERDPKEKFLLLCFNKKLAQTLADSFNPKYKKNIASYSLFSLLYRVQFDFEKLGITQKTPFEKQFEIIKSPQGTKEFQEKFTTHLRTHPIDYFLCDETQDMPPNIMRVIYEAIGDCIFFIDEAQKFYRYSMDSIAEVFKHEEFENIDMRGHIKNLKNVYRTPSNIAKCAFEILSCDTKINAYYKKSFYLKENFLDDINFILEDGTINVGSWDSFSKLKALIDTMEEETVILTHYKNSKYENSVSVASINDYIASIGKEEYISAMTFQSIKGLEAKNIVLHNFDQFLITTAKYDTEIMYRKVYVLFTRALQNLYISIENEEELLKNAKLKTLLEIINRHHNTVSQALLNEKKNPEEKKSISLEKLELAKLKPNMSQLKESGEMVIVASELFALVAGLFA